MANTTNAGRAYSASHFVLELGNNERVGFFRSVEGGGIKSEIKTYRAGSTAAVLRQLGKPKYEDIKIQVGMSMSTTFYSWIESFFDGTVMRKDGAIVAGDFLYKERARREFTQALISAIEIPKLDGDDKNACYMTVTISPETVRFTKAATNPLDSYTGGMAQKLWTAANFRFTIDGFDEACKRVTKIDGFSIKQKIHEYKAGNARDAVRVPGFLEFPNVTFYLPEVDAQPFFDHMTKYVVNGEVQASPRLNGVIELQDHKKNSLCEITLSGVDVANIAPQKSEGGSDEIKQIKVEISVESMKFKYTSSTSGGANG
jgi:phage tail-like protein